MFQNQILKSLSKITGVGETDLHLEIPTDPVHGDYATNIAMQINRRPADQDLKEIAKIIVQKLLKDKALTHIVSDIRVQGPGFINFFLSPKALFENLTKILDQKSDYGKSNIGKGKTVIIEYSSPNIAKKFSIGHLRSTIVGQAIYNLYTSLGYDTVGENHFGDWGTQFGMIIAQAVKKNIDISDLTVGELEKLYVDYNLEIKNNPSLHQEAKTWFKKLEEGDQTAREIWQKAYDVSLSDFNKIYQLLDVSIDHAHGESFYEDKMPSVIAEARTKGVSKKSEGAEIIEFSSLPPAMIVKSDGTTTYFARDLTAIKYRIDTWNPVKIIYEVGVEQSLHFRQLFEAARKMGWAGNDLELKHLAHGHYQFGGQKMSTRKGTVVHLEDIVSRAVKKATELGSTDQKIAQQVGIGALKYFDLMHSPQTTIDFNWESVMNMEGNSGPYLQYTFARTQSVLRKANLKPVIASEAKQSLNHQELALLRKFTHFPEVIAASAAAYAPNFLCNYLYDLAQTYNTFYNAHKIISVIASEAKQSSFRLGLTSATGTILKSGLTLLGIRTPQNM